PGTSQRSNRLLAPRVADQCAPHRLTCCVLRVQRVGHAAHAHHDCPRRPLGKAASSTMSVKKVRKTTVPANQRIAAGSKNRIRQLIRNSSRCARPCFSSSRDFLVLRLGEGG